MSQHTIEQIAQSLRACKGNSALAAHQLRMDHAKLYALIQKTPALRAIVDDCQCEAEEAAEATLRAATLKGERWAVREMLRRREARHLDPGKG